MGQQTFVKNASRFDLEAITEPPDADEKPRYGRLKLDLLAQIEDVRIDGAIGDGGAVAPCPGDQLVATEHAPAIPQEDAEQAELLWRDLDGLPGAPELGPIEVDFAVAKTRHPRLVTNRAPQLRTDASAKLAQAERLGHVVVGARIEPQLLLGFLRARGQQDDRGGDACFAQFAAHIESIHLRQHHVEQYEIPLAVGATRESLGAVRGHMRVVPLAMEILLEAQDDVRFVFDDEDACHGEVSSRMPRTATTRMVTPPQPGNVPCCRGRPLW